MALARLSLCAASVVAAVAGSTDRANTRRRARKPPDWEGSLCEQTEVALTTFIRPNATSLDLAYVVLACNRVNVELAAAALANTADANRPEQQSWLLESSISAVSPGGRHCLVRILQPADPRSNGEVHPCEIASYVLSARQRLGAVPLHSLSRIPWREIVSDRLSALGPEDELGHAVIAGIYAGLLSGQALVQLSDRLMARVEGPDSFRAACWGLYDLHALAVIGRLRVTEDRARVERLLASATNAARKTIRWAGGSPRACVAPEGYGSTTVRTASFVGHMLQSLAVLREVGRLPLESSVVDESLRIAWADLSPVVNEIPVGALSHFRIGALAWLRGRPWS